MADPVDHEELGKWHRQFGAGLFNRTWELIDKRDRSADDDAEMLLAATASRWHWGHVGGPEEIATGDWQVAHVASLLGFGDVARFFAGRNLDVAESSGWDGWRLASAHEGMARAMAASGDAEGRARHLDEARSALAREPDEEDKRVIGEQIASVPEARNRHARGAVDGQQVT